MPDRCCWKRGAHEKPKQAFKTGSWVEEARSEPNLYQDVNFTGETAETKRNITSSTSSAGSHDGTAEVVGCSHFAWSFPMAGTHKHKHGSSEAFKRAGTDLRLWSICVISVDAQVTQ